MNARRDKSTREWPRVYVLLLFVLFCFCFLLREWDTNPQSVWFISSRTSQEEENCFDKTVDCKKMKSVWNAALHKACSSSFLSQGAQSTFGGGGQNET